MAVTEAQARRAARRADVPWNEKVKDPRAEWNQRHDHRGLLSVLVAAFSCGRIHLRKVEDFSADLPAETRRKLGLKTSASDSTFYRLLSEHEATGFRETVQAQVRALIDAKVVQNDVFPVGVASWDGKKIWSTSTGHVDGARESLDEKSGVLSEMLMTMRVALTSSQACPVLDAELIGDKDAESPAFRVSFPRVCEKFGGKFDIATGDAGLCARENAQLVHDRKKFYLWGLKGNQPKLHALAEEMFNANPGALRTRSAERRNGYDVVRELHSLTVKDVPEADMPGIEQMWRVRQQTFAGDKVVVEEVRYFVSSIPPRLLSPTQQLALVRLHWAIENNAHWTMDVALTEDDVQPCQQNIGAIEVVAWLRVLGYNLLAAWRARADKKDQLPMPWARCMELLRDAFVFGAKVPTVTLA